MSTDLRTEINDADSVSGWSSDGASPSLNTLTGQRYEGTGCIDGQHTNTDEATWIGGLVAGDYSDRTIYFLLKDNLVDTFVNGGVQAMLLDSGAGDRVGYFIGGNDAPGLDLSPYYRGFKFDVSEAVITDSHVYAGALANIDLTNIVGIGIGTLHLAKAQGNVPNIFIDRITYHNNDSYALRINGGTSGAPESTTDVQGDDVTNGWGMVAQPKPGQFDFFAPTEWGEPSANADSYFDASNEAWTFIGDNNGGTAVNSNHFIFRLTSNATDTQSFVLDTITMTMLGTRGSFDFSDSDFDIVKLTGVTFTDWGVLIFPDHVANDKFLDTCIFNNCNRVTLNSIQADNCTFNGSNTADGAVLYNTSGDSDNSSNHTFNSDGSGHAIQIGAVGTYNFDGFVFNGYASTDGSTGNEAIYVTPIVGTVTINVTNGLTPSVRTAGATVVINNNVNVTFDNLVPNTEVRVYRTSDDVELDGVENSGTSFTASVEAGTNVYYTIHNVEYEHIRVEDFTWPSSATTIPVQQRFDNNYVNN